MVTTSTQTNEPWKVAQPYITQGMKAYQGLLNKGVGFKAPQFQTYVPFSSQTQQGLDMTQQLAGQGNPLAGQSMGAIGGILSGDINDKYNNLYANADNEHFAQAVQGQSDQIANDVQRQFGGLGRTGSAANTGALVSQIGDFREKALANQWNQNIANQANILSGQTQGRLGAVAAAPGAYQQQYLPAQMMGQVGSAYEDLAQRKLQAKLDKYNTNQQSGWNRTNAFSSGIAGTGGTSPGFGMQTVAKPSNPLGALFGGALSGASVGSAFGPVGTGIGALTGGAAGYYSSQYDDRNRW